MYFDNDIVTIGIFVKGLWDAPTMAVKIYGWYPQTLAEVIRLVKKRNATHHLTATPTPPMVSMMSSNDRRFVCGGIGHIGHHCPDAQCYSCDAFGHFAQDCFNKIPPSGIPCQHDRSHSRHWYTHTQRDRWHFTYYSCRHGDILAGHSPATIPTATKTAVPEGTPHSPHPAAATACAALQPIDVPITTCAMTSSAIVTSHSTLATSPADITDATP